MRRFLERKRITKSNTLRPVSVVKAPASGCAVSHLVLLALSSCGSALGLGGAVVATTEDCSEG